MNFFKKITDALIIALYVLGAVALMVMMFIVVGNSLGRTFFNLPIFGAIEIAGLAGVVVVAVSIGFAQRDRTNVVVDVIIDRLSQRKARIADIVSLLFTLAALGLLLYAIINDAVESLTDGEATFISDIPIAPFKITWAVGVAILCIYTIRHLIKAIGNGRKE
jgi:TRAP-type C4-dicarboxylate transport system permease small subunit